MTAHLDVTLTPAQWEHYDRHGWTLVAAPTIPSPVTMRAKPNDIPVPATVPCPECGGTKMGYTVTTMGYSYFGCTRCADDHGIPTGVVPRVVGIIRPERFIKGVGDEGEWRTIDILPAERVDTATVTPVPVENDPACEEWEKFVYSDPYPKVWLMSDDALEHDVTALFATPPNPGTTVWRLDKENTDEC